MFFIVGLQIHLAIPLVFISATIAAMVGVIRFASVYITNQFTELTHVEVKVARLEFSNGLTALVLSQLPQLLEGTSFFTNPSIFVDLTVPIVVLTSLFGALVGPRIYNEWVPELDEPLPEQLDE